MQMRRRKIAQPLLLGKASPSLAIMQKMSPEELNTKIERLATEAARLAKKIENLKAHRPSPEERIAELTKSLERLQALEKSHRDRLSGRSGGPPAREGSGGTGYRPMGGSGGGGHGYTRGYSSSPRREPPR